jgi:DNA topoisomerase III
MTTLYLCEKPSQAKDLAPFVGARNRDNGYFSGDGVVVTWGFGHLLGQADPDIYDPALKSWRLETLPFIPKQWIMVPNPKSKPQFELILKLLRNASQVVIATDADREGEVIAREILVYARYQGGIKRLWLGALDAATVKKGLANLWPEERTLKLFESGLGRQRADWLAGMMITRALSVAFGQPGQPLHSGRVQSPVLALVVRREKAIAGFISKTHYGLDIAFSIMGSTVSMNWVMPATLKDAAGHCVQQVLVKAVADKVNGRTGRVSSVVSTPKRELAPLPYYLGSLQKEASAKFGIKAAAVLDACQALYEKHKATTYPRTDCEYLPSSMQADAANVLNALCVVDGGLKALVGKAKTEGVLRCFNDKKITAHHAIIPTANSSVSMSTMSKIEQIIYEMIRKRFIAQFLGEHLFMETLLGVACEGEAFTQTGKVTTQQGWLQAMPALESIKPVKDEQTSAKTVILPACEVGAQAINLHAKTVSKKTTPPERYTEGTLIGAMENIAKEIDDVHFKEVMKNKEKAGIGTDATRADTIEKLLSRSYIATEKKYLVPTAKGAQLVELLEAVAPGLVDPVLTAQWEEKLMQVEHGQFTLQAFEAELAVWLTAIIDSIKGKAGTWPVGRPQLPAGVPYKPAHSEPIRANQNMSSMPITGPKCPSCEKGFLRLTTSHRGSFWGCSNYREGTCKATFNDAQGAPDFRPRKALEKPNATNAGETQGKPLQQTAQRLCGACGKPMKLRTSARGEFYGCTGYPYCKTTQQL